MVAFPAEFLLALHIWESQGLSASIAEKMLSKCQHSIASGENTSALRERQENMSAAFRMLGRAGYCIYMTKWPFWECLGQGLALVACLQ